MAAAAMAAAASAAAAAAAAVAMAARVATLAAEAGAGAARAVPASNAVALATGHGYALGASIRIAPRSLLPAKLLTLLCPLFSDVPRRTALVEVLVEACPWVAVVAKEVTATAEAATAAAATVVGTESALERTHGPLAWAPSCLEMPKAGSAPHVACDSCKLPVRSSSVGSPIAYRR